MWVKIITGKIFWVVYLYKRAIEKLRQSFIEIVKLES